jgi:hypothetical protein
MWVFFTACAIVRLPAQLRCGFVCHTTLVKLLAKALTVFSREVIDAVHQEFPRLGFVDTITECRRECSPSSGKPPVVSFPHLPSLTIRLQFVSLTRDTQGCHSLIPYQVDVDIDSVSSRQVGVPIAMDAIKTSLAVLKDGSALAAKIPYIAPVAGLLLQALTMWDASHLHISSNIHPF